MRVNVDPGLELYDAIVDDAAFALLPVMIAREVGARSGMIHHTDGGIGFEGCQLSYLRVFPDGGDIWGRAAIGSGIHNRSVALDTLIPIERYRKSLLWNEVHKPSGDDTGHCLSFVGKVEAKTLFVWAHRSFSEGAFDANDAARLDGLAHDVSRIYRARLLIEQRDTNSAPDPDAGNRQ